MQIYNAKGLPEVGISARYFTVAAISLAALLSVAANAHAAPPVRSSEGPWAKGRVLVMPKAGLSETELARIAGAHGAKARKITSFGLYLIELPPNASEKAVAALLAHNPHLKFAELDQFASSDFVPNDPYFGSQWHLSKIQGPSAWGITQGSGVTIAILDSGVDPAHSDLKERLLPGYNFVDGNTNTSDVRGHGTKVAGTAAAAMNNATGVASVAGQAKIMPIRVSNADGYATWSAMAQGLTYAADKGAQIANMSFNGVAGSSSVLSAAKYLRDKGGLSFVSAGNSNLDPGYSSTSTMIIVAATTSTDNKASFSNFGDHVHLSAPGSGIYTTSPGNAYASVSGTSFSAPVAAGVAALVMSANPSLTNTQVESILFSTAADLGTTGRDTYFGHGRIDAARAVNAALATTDVPASTDSQSPVARITSPTESSTVSGVVPVNVAVSDDVGVTSAELLINGKLSATDTTSPFGFSWDTRVFPDGMANVNIRAYDKAGNTGQSASVAVNVVNSTATETTPPTKVKRVGQGSRKGERVQ